MDTPDWLTPTHAVEPVLSHTKSLQLVNEAVFESIFESVTDRMALGHRMRDILSDDPRAIDQATFLRWIAKNKDKARALAEAKRMGTHMVMEEMIDIADGKDSMEDVARSTLRVNARRIYLKAYNPQVFGDAPSTGENLAAGGVTININAVNSPFQQPSIQPVEVIENE